MTDNEIIKALELCNSSFLDRSCRECQFYKVSHCSTALINEGINLINRQKAEIEKKDTEIAILIRKNETLKDEVSELRAEVERLQREILSCNTKIEVIQEAKEQLEKDVFNAEMNLEHIEYEYELLKQEKSVVKSEAYREFMGEFVTKVKNALPTIKLKREIDRAMWDAYAELTEKGGTSE